MKRMLKSGSLLGLLILFSPCLLPAKTANGRLEKEYQKSYTVNKDAKLTVKNKFGTVHLNTWDKSEIEIDVIISIDRYFSKSKTEKLLDGIKVEFKGNKDFVEAVTEMPRVKNSGNLKMNIDYHISLPKTIKLNIYQSFGNIIVNDDWVGPTSLEVKYGTLQVMALENTINQIEVAYGKIIAEDIEKADIDISYSSLNIDKANKLDLRSAYNSLDIDEVNDLEIKTSFDKVNVDKVVSLNGKSNYSNVDIDLLVKSIDLELDFGGLDIDHLEKDFKTVRIESDNAGVDIDIDNDASFKVDVLTRYGKFYVFDESSINKEKVSFQSYKYTGTVGKKNAESEIIIDADYASIEIK